ncbi:MAG: hypothetical protein WBP64_14160 [Nitrososphaeraceae archaeon]
MHTGAITTTSSTKITTTTASSTKITTKTAPSTKINAMIRNAN